MKATRNYPPYLSLLAGSICVILLWPELTSVRAQDAQVFLKPGRSTPNSNAARAANLRIDSNLVLVPVLVTDRQDRLVTGLAKEHFQVFEDKVEQTITHFGLEDAPVSVGIAFDCSGSMGSKMEKARAAVVAFLKEANPEDEFSMVDFSDRANLVADFTDKPGDIQNRLVFTRSNGRTALLDAIYLLLDMMKHAKHTRKAILIVSDGGDNCSRYTTREVKKRVREADVQIYSIGILEPFSTRSRSPEEMDGPALLNDFAHTSGGRFYEADDLNVLPGIAAKIGEALRNQYVLGYSPSMPKRDGKYHRILVKLVRPKGTPALRASFRSGYFAPEP